MLGVGCQEIRNLQRAHLDRESNRNVHRVDRQRITDKASETVEETQMTLLNEHCMIDTANAPPDDKLSNPDISGLHSRMDLRLAYRDGCGLGHVG